MDSRRSVRCLAVALIAGGAIGVGTGSLVTAPVAGASGWCAAPDSTHFTVTSSADSGTGSLRAALAAAQNTGGTVCVTPGLGTITLASQISFPGTSGLSVAVVGNGVTVVGTSDGEYGAALTFGTPWPVFLPLPAMPILRYFVSTAGEGGGQAAIFTGGQGT